MKQRQRNSNIEVLRIISIILIILCHYYQHTIWPVLSPGNEKYLMLIGMWPRLAINCFILITGYYGIHSNYFNIKRLIRLIRERWIYSFLITVFVIAIKIEKINLKVLIWTIAPLLTCRHNYITSYVIMCILSPFLCEYLQSLNKHRYGRLLIIVTFLFSIIPSAVSKFSYNTYAYAIWMSYIYSVGGYIRKHGINIKKPGYIFVLLMVFTIVATILSPRTGASRFYNWMNNQYNFAVLVEAVCLFLLFCQAKPWENNLVNWLSGSILGIYLIHDDPLVRDYLWNTLGHSFLDQDRLFFIKPFIIASLVFIIGVAVDKLIRFVFIDRLSFLDGKIMNFLQKR